MITAREIQEKTFEKSFNGYNMSQVDDFLEQLVAEITAITKENASLKGKMRVLVEKVEEYRQTEDSMRLALLSAQKLSAQIESEAQEKADAALAEARDTAEKIKRRATDSVVNERAKLEEAKKATDKFLDHMRTVCQKQMEFYEKLSQMQLVGSAPAEVAALDASSAPKKPASSAKPRQKKPKELEAEKPARSAAASTARTPAARTAAASKPAADILPDDGEEEPTRRFGDAPAKKRREYGEFRFSDDV